MANLKNVIYLSNEDYETLVSTGTVTIDGEVLTYDENNIYITPDKLASTSEDGLMSAVDKVKLDKITGVTNTVASGSTDVVTSGAVYTAINNLPAPMIYKGTLGTGGTITDLPTASSSNEGFTYKVITPGTYASQSAKVGDVFISNGSAWTLIPAGDDIEDTWRQINVNGAQFKGTGLSTGLVNFKDGSNVNIKTSGNDIIVSAVVPTKTSDLDNDSGYVTGPSSSTANAVPRYDGTTGKIIKNSGVTISDANVLSAAQLAANIIETGTGDNNYFQSRKFRGEGNATTYYHAIDFGFANHDRVDFYEYGGIWNFWKNQNPTPTTDDGNLCLQIGDTYVKNKNNTFTWPTKGGTLAIADDIPEALKNPNALTFGTKTYDGSSAQEITLADLGGQAAGNYVTTDTPQTITSVKSFSSVVSFSSGNNNIYLTSEGFVPQNTSATYSLGSKTYPWTNIYATKFNVADKASFSYNSSTDCVELTWI